METREVAILQDRVALGEVTPDLTKDGDNAAGRDVGGGGEA